MESFSDRLAGAAYAPAFDEVYLVPALSPVEPWQVNLRTLFTANIELIIPIVSSPMDMVTEYETAVVMALYGGIGVLHRNMSIEEQAEMAARVKAHPPVRLSYTAVVIGERCANVVEKARSTGIRTMPLIDRNGFFRGYISLSKIVEKCAVSDTAPVSEDDRVAAEAYGLEDIDRARRDVIEGRIDAAAVVDSAGRLVGTVTLSEALEETTPVLDEEGRLRVAAAISPYDIQRARALERHVDALVSDIAHFHNRNVLDAARRLVAEVGVDFVAGNIGTAEAARDTISTVERVAGLRVGIGGGSICTTPIVAGAYAPTLWAVAQVRDAVEELGANTPIIADGGLREPGDIVKALAAGASTAMLGYLLAGTDEAPAPLIKVGEKMYKPYRGMASSGAMARRYAADRYSRKAKRVEEGVEGLVPYRGPLAEHIKKIVEAVKAGLGYAGASSIPELWRRARFVRTSPKRGQVISTGQ